MRSGRGAWILLSTSAALLVAGCAAVDRPKPLRTQRDQVAVGQPDKAKPEPAAGQQPPKTDADDGEASPHAISQSRPRKPETDNSVVLAAGQSGRSTGAAASQGERNAAGPAANADPAGSLSGSPDADSHQTDRIRSLLGPAEQALERGDAAAALAQVGGVVENNPHDPQIPISAAALLLRHNQTEGAARLLSQSAPRFPNSPAIHRMLGTALYRLGDYQSAQVAFQQALSLDKSSALSYFLMGCTLAKLGQRGTAEAHLRQAEMLDPRYGVER